MKGSPNPEIQRWLEFNNQKQKEIMHSFDIEKVNFKKYNLPFNKIEFINNISSFYYKGKVGRRKDFLVVYNDEIVLGYIQFASPILNKPFADYLKNKYGKLDFKLINKHVVEMSVCVPFGPLTKFLTGKLLVFIAISREMINVWNDTYNTDIEVLMTTSIYGKSSMYNRVRNLKYLGLTKGYHTTLTSDQIQEIKILYKRHFPHRKIKKTALSEHLIRLYDHLVKAGVQLSFKIPKLEKGVYVCDKFLPLKENLNYWYHRWFLPRYKRLTSDKIS